MTRRYCGRIGAAVVEKGGRCPECGAPFTAHHALPDDVCGTWTRCTRDCEMHHAHGHLCALAPGHAGPHGGGASETRRERNQ